MAKRMLKRIYITMALLFVTGICCFIPNSNLGQTNNFSANAEEVVASDGTWANIVQGGSTAYSFEEAGTSSSPYKIENATDLAYLAYSVNTGTDYAGQYISLLDDLDLGDALWTPIGTDGNHFKGTFLGNGHTISNITISDESNLYSAEYLGLFGVVENASILDLKLAGTYFNIATTYSALSTENKGTFAGQALNSIFSNCRDEMESTEDYPSIFTSNGTTIYKSGSFDGVTADLTTQEAVDNSFVDGSGNSSVAYLARYVLKDEHITDGAGFHYFDATGNEVSGGNKYISVPVTSSMSADGFAWGTDTKEVALALGFDNDAPVLRENAGAQQFYVRYPGYKANIPQLFTASFDKGLILNITFNDSGESGLTIYFDYDYGARTNEFTGTIGYDQSFVEIADQLESNKVFDRAGYTLTYFANDKDFNEANITSCFTRGHTTVSSNSFPIAGATYYLTVDGEKNKANHGEGLINFLISSEEGGSFSDYNDIFAAIDGEDSDSSKKVTIKSATGSTEGYETSGIYQHSSLGYPVAEMAYLSGKNVITFTLAKGYQIDISNRDNGSKEGSSTSLKDYAPSGIYLNFANHTGKNAEYSLTKTNGDGSTISANNDDYASVNIGNIRVTTNTDKSTTYEIEIDNLLGGNDIDGDGGLDYTGNGEINIVIERAWVTYDITPIWMGDVGSIPTAFSYSYKITELAGTADYTNENLAYLYANTDEKESEIEVSLNDSSAVFSYDSTIDKYILNERVYLKLRYNEYVKLEFNIGDGQDYVVIGASCRDDDKSFVRTEPSNNNKTMYMGRSSSAGEDMPLNLLSRDDNGAYTSTLYQLPQITSPQTLVRVKYYDENGNALSNEVLGDASSKYYNISIAVNDTKGLQNTDSTLVNVKSSGKIQATNNKFYKVKEIQIGQGVDWTTAVATHSFAQNGSNFPIIWGGMSYITAINQDSVEYEIRVYLEKVKYQVLVSSEFKDESIDDTNKSNFFTVAPTIYHVDDEGNTLNSGTSLWLEWDQKFKIDWTLSDLGKKLFITESVNGIKAYEKHYCPSSDEMPNVANITSLNKNTSTTILAEDVPASWAMTITWENRKAQVSIEEAVDKDGNTISTALNGKTLVSLDFVYDADNNSIVIADTTVGSISVSNAYYFTGFRWVDVSVEAKDYTESFGQFLTDADFVSFIIEKAYEAGNSTTITYKNLKVLIKERLVDVYFEAGNAEGGEITDPSTEEIKEYSFTQLRRDGVSVSGYSFSNIGHIHAGWNASTGDVSGGVYSLTKAELSNLWGLSGDYTSYTAFSTNLSNPGVHLVSIWEKISYYVSIDGKDGQAVVELNDSFKAVYDNNQSAKISYTFGSDSLTGEEYPGYDATGFTITSTDGANSNDYTFTSNEYSLTIDLTFIKTYIEDSYWHKQNTSDTPIQINVIKTGATYKLYIEENEENYYSVAWDSSIEGDTDLGGSDANGVYINVAYAGGFDNLKTAIENGALKLTRNYFNLTSFKYNGSTVMSYSDAWTLAGLTYQNEATLITPIWTMGDLDGFISNTLFTNGADNSIEYRLGTYQEIMSASLSSGETIALNSELLNGLKITGFGYSLNGDSDLLTGNIKFNTCNLSTSGENTIFFYVEVKDLIETSQTKTASSASITITAVKNEFVFEFANNAVSAKYNGSSSLGKLTWNSTIKFAIKYDWKGDEITQDWSENGTWYDLEKFSTEYSRPGSAEAYDAFWDAGEDKDITFKLLGKGGSSGIKYAGGDTNIGEINYQNIFDGLEFTLAGALEVTKLDINLNFNIKFANDGAATSYTSETQSGSVSGLDEAEYSFTLIFDESIIGEYNAVENISKIKICNLKVNILSSEKEIIKTFEMTDENGESLDSNVNFTYSISETSILEIGAFSTIFLEIKEAISYTYNGLKPTSGVVSYSDGKYILTITNKDTLLAQVEVWSGYKIAGENAEFSDEERGSYIDAISFDFSSFKADVGSYTLEVNDFTLGSDEIKVNMSGLTTVDILKKEITISNISKVFDGTAVFDSSKEGHSITVDGLVDGESLVFTGTFQDIYGNDGIRVGSWDNTVISFESGNYKFSGEAESGTLYSDNEVLAVGTVIPATGTITSLDAQTFDYGLNASSWDWAEGLWNNAGGGEKSIKGFNVEEYVENIKLEESNISTSTGGYYSAGDDFTVVFIVTIPEFQYEKDGKFTNEHVISCNVVINKKAITVTNTSQAITKKYDGTNTLTVGLGQAINAEGGYFTADVLAGDIVTVISGAYSDSSVGEHSIELDFGGADHGNYIINHSVSGTITENAFTIYLYDEYNAEVGNVVVEYDPDTFDEAGALEVMGKLEALIPAKDGYELDYIVSFDGGTIITQENLKEFIDSAISDSSDSLNFKFYYKIVTFALTLKFDESFKITNHNTDEIISNGDGSIAEATFELTIDESLSLVIDYQAGYYVNITDDGQFSGDYSHNSAGYIISISGLYADEILTLEKVLDTYIIYLAVHDDFAGVAEIPTEVREQRVQIGDSINLAQTILDDDYFLLEWNIYDGNYSKIADAGDTTILFDESFALMMEYQAFGAPQEYYTFYAVYTDAMVSIEIEVVGGANGVIVGQGDLDDVKVLNDSKKAVVLDKYDESNVLATISYREDITGGYHLESITFYDEDGEEIDKTNIGFKDEESVVYFMVTAEIDAIKIVIEANTNVITIQAGVSIDGATQTPSNMGGSVYLSDANGNLLGDDSYISEGVTNFMKGSNYLIEAKTGIVIYFVLSEVSGFVGDLSANGPGNVAIGSSMKTNDDGKEVKVYSLSGITGATSVIASFRAETFKVNASLVSDLDTLVGINGGVIAVEENKTILAGINNQYFVQASAVNGSDVVLTVKSRLGYHLYDSGTSNYVCYSIQTESGVTSYAVAGSIDDWATTGYSQKLSIKLENITENVNVYILVIPNAYTVNFVNKIGDKEATLGSTTITYGQSFSGLAREILYPEAPEDYYSFNGYWTKELSQGSQYIDKGSLATSGWKETGYYFNGAQYVAQEHFDVNNNTFTLYAGWTFKKAKLTFSFGPSSVVASYAYGIRSLVLNDDTDKVAEDEQVILWTTQSNVWYGEVYYGSVLKVQAPSFDGYEFVRIVVSHNGLDYNYTNQTCTLNAFEEGEYGIAIIYHPIFSIAVQNKGATSTDGGSAWIEQDGKSLGTSGTFDYSKYVTLKAKANDGYKFLYFENAKTGHKYYGSINLDGEYYYTFDSLITSELQFVAVFEGKAVVIEIANEELLQFHEIISITANGESIYAKTTSFNSRIGDEIVITIKKSQGYLFALYGGKFTYTVDENDIYTFVCKVGLDGVQEADKDSYKMLITFSVGKEKIGLTVTKTLFDEGSSDISNEFSKIGNIYFIDAKGTRTKLDSQSQLIIYYGEKVSLQFAEEDYYKVSQVLLTSNGSTIDLAGLVSGGKFDITVSILEQYFAKEIAIEIVFTRQTWVDVMSTSLQGKGTAKNPLLITSAEDFAYAAYLINNDMMINGLSAKSAYYKVTKNINFYGKYWTPIGTKESPFEGNMDLGSHSLSNIVHCNNYTNPAPTYGGLFWVVSEKAVITQETSSWIVWVIIASVAVVIGGVVLLAVAIRKRKKERYNEYL